MKRQSAFILLGKFVAPDIDTIVEALHKRHPRIEASRFVGSRECSVNRGNVADQVRR